MILYFDQFCNDGKVHVQDRFWTIDILGVLQLRSLCFTKALKYMGLEESKAKMISFGCDGANANIAIGGLKGLLTKEGM